MVRTEAAIIGHAVMEQLSISLPSHPQMVGAMTRLATAMMIANLRKVFTTAILRV
jgi:hypothetical protein